MRRWCASGFAVVLILAGSVAARAAPSLATFVEQTRFVTARGQIGLVQRESSLAASDFSPFDESVEAEIRSGVSRGVAQASQNSFGTATGFEVAGRVSTSGISLGLGAARSDVEFVFEVLQTSSFTLVGEVLASGDASTDLYLNDSDGSRLLSHTARNLGNRRPFVNSGLLSPGAYTFRARTHSCSDELGRCGIDTGTGSFAATLVLVAIPEPSTAVAVALGLLALSARSRRRRRRESGNAPPFGYRGRITEVASARAAGGGVPRAAGGGVPPSRRRWRPPSRRRWRPPSRRRWRPPSRRRWRPPRPDRTRVAGLKGRCPNR